MSAKTNIWLATASAFAILAGPALAQTTTTDPNVTIVNPDGPAEQTGEAIDNAAENAGESMENAAEATGDAARDATAATGEAVEDAGEAMQNAAQPTEETTAESTTTVVEPAETETEAVEVETDAETTTAQTPPADAEGTPVAGQIFEQDADTFLASTLMDGSVINDAGEEIGDVNDLVMTGEGEVTGVVIGVGGWLGIGQKDVAIEMSRIEITSDEDGEFAFQLNATREELEDAPEFRTRDDIEAEEAATAAGAGGAGGAGGMSTTTSTPPATAAQ